MEVVGSCLVEWVHGIRVRGAGAVTDINGVGQAALAAVRRAGREALDDHGEDKFRRGFTAGAGIAVRRIQGDLDGLKEQMKTSGLTKTEQALYARLDQLLSAIEADCDRYWQGSGIEWRLPKPVATGVVREPSDPEE